MKYIDPNPVRARLWRKPWRYAWSSAAVHVDDGAGWDILSLSRWYDMTSPAQWRNELSVDMAESDVSRLRSRTYTGRPLGSDSFSSELERLLGRRIRPLPVGRVSKSKKTKRRKMLK